MVCIASGIYIYKKEIYKKTFSKKIKWAILWRLDTCMSETYNISSYLLDDDTRVSLSHLPGIPGSDYINANYINVSRFNSKIV